MGTGVARENSSSHRGMATRNANGKAREDAAQRPRDQGGLPDPAAQGPGPAPRLPRQRRDLAEAEAGHRCDDGLLQPVQRERPSRDLRTGEEATREYEG